MKRIGHVSILSIMLLTMSAFRSVDESRTHDYFQRIAEVVEAEGSLKLENGCEILNIIYDEGGGSVGSLANYYKISVRGSNSTSSSSHKGFFFIPLKEIRKIKEYEDYGEILVRANRFGIAKVKLQIQFSLETFRLTKIIGNFSGFDPVNMRFYRYKEICD